MVFEQNRLDCFCLGDQSSPVGDKSFALPVGEFIDLFKFHVI